MKEKINRGNYEVFLIDFLDGNLDSETHAQVLFFLENNPDIAEEFNGISDFDLEQSYASFDEKDNLKIKFENNILINPDNCEHYFIAYHEGDLSADEKIQVEDFIENNPSFEKEFKVFSSLKLSSNTEIIYKESDNLQMLSGFGSTEIRRDLFEQYCIDYYEDNLDSETSETLLKSIASSPELDMIFSEYAKTYVIADTSIIYENKSALYQRRFIGIVPLHQYISSVAAVAVLLIMFNFFITPSTTNISYVSSNKKTTNTTKSNDFSLNKKKQEKLKKIDLSNINNDKKEKISTTQSETKTPKPKEFKISLQKADLKTISINIKTEVNISEKIICKPIHSFVNDSSYYLIVASNPLSKDEEPPKGLKKVSSKISRIFKQQKEAIAKTPKKETFKNMANLAITGFNKLTESNIALR